MRDRDPRTRRPRPSHHLRAGLQRPGPGRPPHRRRAHGPPRRWCSGPTACTASTATTSRWPGPSACARSSTSAPTARSSTGAASRTSTSRSHVAPPARHRADLVRAGPRGHRRRRPPSCGTATSTCSSRAAPRIARAVELIADDAPLLFHCAAGKDRTGVVAAVVLGLLGVSPRGHRRRLPPQRRGHGGLHRLDRRASSPTPLDAMTNQPPEYLEAPAEAMLGFLAARSTRVHGSMEGLARHLGVDARRPSHRLARHPPRSLTVDRRLSGAGGAPRRPSPGSRPRPGRPARGRGGRGRTSRPRPRARPSGPARRAAGGRAASSTMLAPARPEHRGDRAEAAGRVGHLDQQAGQPAGAHEAAHDHRREQPRVDVAARQHDADRAAAGARAAACSVEQRGEAGGAGPLDDDLLDLEEQVDRLLDGVVGDGDELVDVRGDERRGERRRPRGTAMPSATVRARRSAASRPGGGGEHRRPRARSARRRRTMSGRRALAATAMPGDEPAAADGHHERLELGVVREQLEGDRALPGDHGRVVVGVHEHAALVGRDAARPRRSPRRGRRRAAPRGRRAPRCGAPSRTGWRPASRSWRRCRGARRGGPRPGRGCRPTSPRRPRARSSSVEEQQLVAARRAP